jgi:hypothetical protein
VYKLFFLCQAQADSKPDPTETLDVGWFSLDRLPELSHTRITERSCASPTPDTAIPRYPPSSTNRSRRRLRFIRR